MTDLLSTPRSCEKKQEICPEYQQASDLISHYNRLYSEKNKDMPHLPEWALHAIYEHFVSTDALVESMSCRKEFLRQFMITHRGAALDCFFDQILAVDSKTRQYLIYKPKFKRDKDV